MGRSFDGTLFLNILFVEDYFNEKADSQISFLELLDKLDEELLKKMLSKKDVISFVLTNETDPEIAKWLGEELKA
ncbi:hypothetical protein SAMN02745229_02399 [Butyrivibrio fibrisolvens DSM 3071]|uniref:Uncharacterized protein n=1 Tax=Butyrivibrio fibrisolvens DSM 3071 TaxID=1121131 RepID=A0A1M5ZLU7_BUTFI|nr:hypothetical protein [Butyrivibrio fibrisolvens]SHI25108.1 hypothetical protein SAMN02745229_02399 [Butyrivibrio fibrisolvens DSM 3071]